MAYAARDRDASESVKSTDTRSENGPPEAEEGSSEKRNKEGEQEENRHEGKSSQENKNKNKEDTENKENKPTQETNKSKLAAAASTAEKAADAIEQTAEKAFSAVEKTADNVANEATKVADKAGSSTGDVAAEAATATKAGVEHATDVAQGHSTILLTIQGIAATFLRVLVVLSLRVFPLRACAVTIVLYAIYLITWLIYDNVAMRSPITYADAVKRHASPVKALLFGFSTRSRRLNIAQLVLHSILALLFLDFYYAPYMFPSHYGYNLRFARIGALTPTRATVHVRYPNPLPLLDGLWEDDADSGVLHDASMYAETPVRIVWRRVLGDTPRIPAGAAVRDPRRWERGPLLRLAEDTDWTATAVIDDLLPATKYEWRLAFVHNNTFAPLPERPVSFVTWPDPRLSSYLKTRRSTHTSPRYALDDPNHFTFAATSCIKPDFPYHPAQFWLWNWLLRAFGIGGGPGGIARRNRIRGFDLMADRLVDAARGWSGIRFLLELGDVIYADVPHYEGAFLSSYRKLYRNLFASHSFRRIYSHIPVLGIFDDHEVVNNWSGAGDGSKPLPESPPPSFTPGIKAWSEYIGSANPRSERDQHYFSFQYGDSAFFVIDARTHRTHPHLEGPQRTMLGEKQRNALFSWLAKVNHTTTFKFVVTPVPFTSVWGGPFDLDGYLDGWYAYNEDRKALLDELQYVPNVIIISGDRHEFAAVSMRDTVLEFSTSPLSMFYIPIRTASQEHVIEPDSEVFLKYLPDGHHKWTEFEVDTRDPIDPVVYVTVLVNGKEAWQVAVHGQPVHRPQSSLGSLAQSLLELLGFKPRKWFD